MLHPIWWLDRKTHFVYGGNIFPIKRRRRNNCTVKWISSWSSFSSLWQVSEYVIIRSKNGFYQKEFVFKISIFFLTFFLWISRGLLYHQKGRNLRFCKSFSPWFLAVLSAIFIDILNIRLQFIFCKAHCEGIVDSWEGVQFLSQCWYFYQLKPNIRINNVKQILF